MWLFLDMKSKYYNLFFLRFVCVLLGNVILFYSWVLNFFFLDIGGILQFVFIIFKQLFCILINVFICRKIVIEYSIFQLYFIEKFEIFVFQYFMLYREVWCCIYMLLIYMVLYVINWSLFYFLDEQYEFILVFSIIYFVTLYFMVM